MWGSTPPSPPAWSRAVTDRAPQAPLKARSRSDLASGGRPGVQGAPPASAAALTSHLPHLSPPTPLRPPLPPTHAPRWLLCSQETLTKTTCPPTDGDAVHPPGPLLPPPGQWQLCWAPAASPRVHFADANAEAPPRAAQGSGLASLGPTNSRPVGPLLSALAHPPLGQPLWPRLSRTLRAAAATGPLHSLPRPPACAPAHTSPRLTDLSALPSLLHLPAAFVTRRPRGLRALGRGLPTCAPRSPRPRAARGLVGNTRARGMPGVVVRRRGDRRDSWAARWGAGGSALRGGELGHRARPWPWHLPERGPPPWPRP